jgi:glutathione peroxidase
MSLLKKLITSTYPLRMKLSKVTGKGISILENSVEKKAPINFFSLVAPSNTGELIQFDQYRGKKILIVNLASECGYTPQYAELEALHSQHKDLAVLGFPSNDFGAQEPGTDDEIATFCTVNFGVTFPLFKKDTVKGVNRQPVYQWLCDVTKNGWNNEEPQWNFYKYLIDENGCLLKVFSSAVSPLDIF